VPDSIGAYLIKIEILNDLYSKERLSIAHHGFLPDNSDSPIRQFAKSPNHQINPSAALRNKLTKSTITQIVFIFTSEKSRGITNSLSKTYQSLEL
jgi:hypothetical protein